MLPSIPTETPVCAPFGQEVVSSHCTGDGVGGAGGSGGDGGEGGGLGLDFTGKLACMARPHCPAGESSRPRTSLTRQVGRSAGMVETHKHRYFRIEAVVMCCSATATEVAGMPCQMIGTGNSDSC